MACDDHHVCPCAMAWYLLINIITNSCLHEEGKSQKKWCQNVQKTSLLRVLKYTDNISV